MIELSMDTTQIEQELRRMGASLGLLTSDYFQILKDLDKAISERIEETFDREGPNWAPLAPRTVAQREKAKHIARLIRRGKIHWREFEPRDYYRANKGLGRAGPRHPIGQWTGKARRRAIRSGKVGRTKYVRDFGKDDEIRRRLEYLHVGGTYQPPRPIWTLRWLERLVATRGQAYVDRVIAALNQLDRFPDLQSLTRILQ